MTASAPLGSRPAIGASWPLARSFFRRDLPPRSFGNPRPVPSSRGWCRSTSWARLRRSRRPPPTIEPSDPQVAFYLAKFIEQVRSIPSDPIIVRQNWLRAYDFTTQAGALALNDYARTNDPFANVGKQQVAVDVSSVIRASPTSFRVAWIERRYQDGSLARPSDGAPS